MGRGQGDSHGQGGQTLLFGPRHNMQTEAQHTQARMRVLVHSTINQLQRGHPEPLLQALRAWAEPNPMTEASLREMTEALTERLGQAHATLSGEETEQLVVGSWQMIADVLGTDPQSTRLTELAEPLIFIALQHPEWQSVRRMMLTTVAVHVESPPAVIEQLVTTITDPEILLEGLPNGIAQDRWALVAQTPKAALVQPLGQQFLASFREGDYCPLSPGQIDDIFSRDDLASWRQALIENASTPGHWLPEAIRACFIPHHHRSCLDQLQQALARRSDVHQPAAASAASLSQALQTIGVRVDEASLNDCQTDIEHTRNAMLLQLSSGRIDDEVRYPERVVKRGLYWLANQCQIAAARGQLDDHDLAYLLGDNNWETIRAEHLTRRLRADRQLVSKFGLGNWMELWHRSLSYEQGQLQFELNDKTQDNNAAIVGEWARKVVRGTDIERF